MVPGINGSTEKFLADLESIRLRSDKAQREISSGLKIDHPSDDPDEIRGILELRAAIERTGQVQVNLGRLRSESDTAEAGLENAVKIVERATVLASQGANTLETADQRQDIAQEVQGLLEQLVGISQTIVEGRYIFSGDRDQSPAYQVNLNNPNGVDRLLTAPATRQVEDATGMAFTPSRTAQDIFDHRNSDDSLASDNVFAAVNNLRLALVNSDQPGVAAALNAVRQAGQYLNTQLGFYGTVQNRVQQAMEMASQLQVRQKTDLSGRQDADLAGAIVELNQSRVQEQAALSARAQSPVRSLFDFLA